MTLRRAWTDLITLGNVNIPNSYTTGTATTITSSNVVTGQSAFWPVADFINTLAAAPVRQPGYSIVTPVDMTNIKAGQWLYVDQGGNPEAVCVTWTNGVSFIASFKYQHNPGFVVQASSFAGLQFRISFPLYTVQAVTDPNTLLLDMPWGGPPQTAQSYEILGCYIQPDPLCWWLQFVWDPVQGIALDCEKWTYQQVLIGDPQLTTSDNPTIVVPVPQSSGFSGTGAQVATWMVYPPQSTARVLGVIYVRGWPKLIQDTDPSPGFIDSNVFVMGAQAEALRIPIISQDRRPDPYLNVDLSGRMMAEYEAAIDRADQKDQATAPDRLSSYVLDVTGGFSANYQRSHPGMGSWPSCWPGV